MRSQNFGIEIEMTGLTRSAAARIIAGYFGTNATHVGGGYDAYTVRDAENRQWKVVSDSSIRCRGRNNRAAGRDYSVEFVSPICRYEDNDEPGQAAAKRISDKLFTHGISHEIVIPFHKDWNDDLIFSEQEEPKRCQTLQLSSL